MRFFEGASHDFEDDVGVGSIVARDIDYNECSAVRLLVIIMKVKKNES